jgi:hypothetical protein
MYVSYDFQIIFLGSLYANSRNIYEHSMYVWVSGMGEYFCLGIGCDFEEVGVQKASRKKSCRPEKLVISFQLNALAEYTFNT